MPKTNTIATKSLSLSLQTMTIQRQGQVDWSVAGDNHCGPKSELKTIWHGFDSSKDKHFIPVKYSVSVTCKPNLDARGFLFDQAMVGKWMERVAAETTSLSCEALAGHVAKRMLAKMAKDVPHCQIVELVLTLQPAPFMAGITVRYA